MANLKLLIILLKTLFVLTNLINSSIYLIFIHCERNETYAETDSNKQLRVDVFNKVTNWGLGSFLSFKKQKHTSSLAGKKIYAFHESGTPTLLMTNDNNPSGANLTNLLNLILSYAQTTLKMKYIVSKSINKPI